MIYVKKYIYVKKVFQIGELIMEMQIQDLVSAIKKEGVDAAQAEGEKIIQDAKKKAEEIVLKAKIEADSILKKAEKEIETIKESAKTSVEHAKRDAMLFFRDSVRKEFEILLEADIQKTVKEETLAQLIIAVLNGENPADYTAEVGEVTEGLKGELAAKIKQGLTIKANPNVHTGFRLAENNGAGYFDCSDEELEKMLKPFFPEISF